MSSLLVPPTRNTMKSLVPRKRLLVEVISEELATIIRANTWFSSSVVSMDPKTSLRTTDGAFSLESLQDGEFQKNLS